MAVYEKVMQRASKDKKTRQLGQISFFSTNEIVDTVEYPDIKEFNKKTLLRNERDIVGVYMSGHPLEEYAEKFKNFTINAETLNTINTRDEDMEIPEEDDKFSEETELLDGQPFTCGGIIVEVKKIRSKSGRDMCAFKLEDLTGTMEVTLFPNIYAKYRNEIVEDALVTVKGKFNVRDSGVSLIGDSVFVWKEEEKAKAEERTGKVYLRFDTKDIDVYSKVKNSLLSYPGEAQVIIRCTSSGSALNFNGKVAINNYLINELSGIIGNENIVVKEAK